MMCYVCHKEIHGYEHFSTAFNQPAPSGKCPLFCNTKKLHEEEARKAAAKARSEKK